MTAQRDAWAAELAERGLDASSGEVVLFEGAPEEAALLYPKNLNAALTIAMAIQPAPLSYLNIGPSDIARALLSASSMPPCLSFFSCW